MRSLRNSIAVKIFALPLLFFLSGFSALVYEILWMKELSLLFGNTVHAAATTLAVFFSGLSLGGYYWGRKTNKIKNPLLIYAFLEIGIACSAILYFYIFDLYYLLYEPLYETFAGQRILFTCIKAALTCGLLFPPAFFMGGTFPIIGHYTVRSIDRLGKTASLLYAINILGAALGAFAAGFYLPLKLGYTHSYLLAIAVNILIALGSFLLVGFKRTGEVSGSVPPVELLKPDSTYPLGLSSIAFLSGFATLGLEVLWTRMFSQVLNNSVYSFAIVMIVFLFSLAMGAFVVSILSRGLKGSYFVLASLLALSGIMVGVSPFLFYMATGGLEMLGSHGGWAGYVQVTFVFSAMLLVLPVMFMGTVFPYLLKMSENVADGVGRTIGKLAAINTVGAIFGSLCAGFLFLELFGLWNSIVVIAFLYLTLSVYCMNKGAATKYSLLISGSILIVSGVLFYNASFLSIVRIDPEKEQLLEVWESSYGAVAVVSKGDSRSIKVNNYYTLGSSAQYAFERRQANIPLYLHQAPQSVFFLGMGTGITANTAFEYAVQKVVTAELIPDVVKASRKYFQQFTYSLFNDERSRIIVGDGRNALLGEPHKYDVIISDLFVPWHAGTGSLYSMEHYGVVSSRLNKGGIFAQWLPVFQLSEEDFFVIVRTMLEVFPQVTLWRNNTLPLYPIYALIGQNEIQPLRKTPGRGRSSPIPINDKIAPYVFYAGNLSLNRDLFDAYPVNTDNKPLIEYSSPVHEWNRLQEGEAWEYPFRLLDLLDTLFAKVPPENDPYLRNMNEEELGFVEAGLSFFKTKVYKEAGRLNEARLFYRDYLDQIPIDVYPELIDDESEENKEQ